MHEISELDLASSYIPHRMRWIPGKLLQVVLKKRNKDIHDSCSPRSVLPVGIREDTV